MYTRHITSIDRSQQMSQLIVNSSVFYFSRTSLQGGLPLISTLAISPVTNGLDGTIVTCMEVGSETMNTSSIMEPRSTTVTIHFVRESQLLQSGITRPSLRHAMPQSFWIGLPSLMYPTVLVQFH